MSNLDEMTPDPKPDTSFQDSLPPKWKAAYIKFKPPDQGKIRAVLEGKITFGDIPMNSPWWEFDRARNQDLA